MILCDPIGWAKKLYHTHTHSHKNNRVISLSFLCYVYSMVLLCVCVCLPCFFSLIAILLLVYFLWQTHTAVRLYDSKFSSILPVNLYPVQSIDVQTWFFSHVCAYILIIVFFCASPFYVRSTHQMIWCIRLIESHSCGNKFWQKKMFDRKRYLLPMHNIPYTCSITAYNSRNKKNDLTFFHHKIFKSMLLIAYMHFKNGTRN